MFPRALFTANPYTRGPQVFSPAADLPAGMPSENLLALWYAGDGTGAGSYVTTAGDGQPVDDWPSAVGSIAPAATTTNRPTYDAADANFNNRGVLVFDGGDELLLSLSGGIVGQLGTYAGYIVASSNVAANADRAFYAEGRSSSDTPAVIMRQIGSTGSDPELFHRYDNNTRIQATGTTALNDGVVRLLTFGRAGADGFVRVNGAEEGTSSLAYSTTTIDQIAIGALWRTGISMNALGRIAMIALYSTVDHAARESAAATHYGM